MLKSLTPLLLTLTLAMPALAEPRITTNNVVTTRGGAPQLLIPAAGHVAGANGTLFRSEINLINYSNRTQRVQLRWLPQGGGPEAFPPVIVTINPLSGIGAEDFTVDVMNIPNGLGAILVTGFTPTDAFDSTSRLYATDRIWTNQPGSAGTVSQTFDVLLASDIDNSTGSVSILGLRRDGQYRVNLGLVNLAQTPQVFAIATSTMESQTVTVPAMSSQQFALGGAATPNLQVVISNATSSGRSTQWVAYGSSVDNITGDSWSMIGYTPSIAP